MNFSCLLLGIPRLQTWGGCQVLVGFIEFATAACLAMDWDEARVAAMADTVAEGLRLRFQEKRTQRVAPNN